MHRPIRRPSRRRHSLTLLSSDVIRRILSNLDWRALLRLKLVCKYLCSVVDESPSAQYTIELAVCGMKDGARTQLTAASKLALLKERNASWEALQWTESQDLTLPQSDNIAWELCAGVYAQFSVPGASTMRLYRLPSQYRNIPASSWRIPLLSDTKDFTMDPAQDLLVLVEKPILIPAHHNTKSYIRIQIHSRSLTTGHRHPSAVEVIDHHLYMRSSSDKLGMDLSIQTCNKFVAVLFIVKDNISELMVWKWKTGQIILRSSSLEIATFAFLTPQLLLVGTVMDETGVTEPRLFVLDISKPSTNKVALTDYVCVFEFPSFDFVVSPMKIVIRSDPSPEWKPNPEAHVPFSIARGQRLFLITTWVEEKKKNVSYDLFVPANILLSSVMALTPQTRRRVINWNEWGPTGTRFLKSPPHSHVWTGYVFGSRFISLVTSPKATAGRHSQTLQIWDFNQLAMKRAAALGFEKENVHLVNDTTVVEDEMFVERVRTSLPYSITTRTLPLPRSPGEPTFTDAMIGEDTILLLNYDRHHRHLRILTF